MNRLISEIEPASLALAVIVLLAAAVLGYRERIDRLNRPSVLSIEDTAHFRRRDRRRSLGLSILCLLALGVVVGSRTPVRAGLRANPWFLAIWLAIFGLILVLLGLAMIDWFDLRRYARNKKWAMGNEHLTAIQAQIERWKSAEDGQAGQTEGEDD